MFDVVIFSNGKFGVRNGLTGNVICKNGKVREFRTAKRAAKEIGKIDDRFAKVIARLSKKHPNLNGAGQCAQ